MNAAITRLLLKATLFAACLLAHLPAFGLTALLALELMKGLAK